MQLKRQTAENTTRFSPEGGARPVARDLCSTLGRLPTEEDSLVTPDDFGKLTNLLPEPILLLSGEGIVLVANRSFSRQFGSLAMGACGNQFADLVVDPAEEVERYLRSCRRSGDNVPGAFAFAIDGEVTRWRIEGAMLEPASDPQQQKLMLRLLPQHAAVRQFTVVSQKVEQLGREVSRRKRAEDDLREQQEYLRTTLQSIGDAVIVTDAEGRVTMQNPVASQLTGWGDEACGQPLTTVFNIVHEKTGAVVENPVERVLREGIVVGLANHTNLIAKDGTARPIADSAAPIRDTEGNTSGVVLVFRDVTEERRAEAKLREESRTTETLNRLSSVLHSELELNRLVQAITDVTNGLLGAEFGAFFYNAVDSEDPSYTLYTLSGMHRERFEQFPLPRATAVFGPTFRGERVVRLDDVTQDPRFGQNPPYYGFPEEHPTVRSYLAAPVVSRSGEVLGGLLFGHSERGVFGDREERLIFGVAAQAAIAIDNARLYQATQESEKHLRQLADSMPQIVWTARPDGHLDHFNRRWYETFSSADPDDDPGGAASWLGVLHPEDVQRTTESWYAAVRSGEPFEIQCRFRERKTGTYRWHLGRGVPIRNSAGDIVRWYGTSTDIEEQKRVEHTSRFLADASDELSNLLDYESTLQRVARLAVPDFADWCVIDVVDADGALRRLAVTHADPEKIALAHQLREAYPPRPDVLSPIQRIVQTGEAEFWPAISSAFLEQIAQDAEHLRILKVLGLRSFIAVPLVLQGRVFGVLSFVLAESAHQYGPHDLTIAKDLSRRAAVAIDNARLYAELKTADRRKNEFLAMLAHELRNPLAPIRSGLDLLALEGHSGETATLMMEQVEHLVRLVDDLLDLARIMQGKIQLRREPVELGTILQRAIDMSSGAVNSRQHRLHVDLPNEPVWTVADPVRLTQVFANLLNNAAKYTDPAGDLWLSAECGETAARIRVRDNGMGIDANLLPLVFELFTQADRSLDRSQGGLGVGLTLVQTLVKMHGGSVTANSGGAGQGSEFTVTLPILETVPPESAEPVATQSAIMARRILVVDDTPAAAQMLRLVLEKLGDHQIEVVHDGFSALSAAKQMRPDIIFLDIGLPRMDGSEVARRLRAQPEFAETLLVALTGYGQDEDRRRTAAAGFDMHLVKPASLEGITRVLHHAKGLS